MLRTGDIDWDKGMINFNILKKRKKGYKEWMAIDDDTLNILKNKLSHITYNPENPMGVYIFISNRHKKDGSHIYFTRKWAFEQIRNITLKCNIIFKEGGKKNIDYNRTSDGAARTLKPGWHPHHFRHSFSIHFLSKANDPTALNILQQQLAHTNINITSTYLKFNQEYRKKILNKVFGGK